MLASVVIPTKDKVIRLSSVLKALESQVTNEVEVIIIFDGCDAETISEFKKRKWAFTPKTIFLPQNVGRAAARNHGIREASGKIVIFMDDDRIPGKDFIRLHIDAHHQPNRIVLGKRYDVSFDEERIEKFQHVENVYKQLELNAVADKSYIPFRHPRNIFRWMYCFTGNLSVDRNVINDIGGFDENFVKWGHEDVDLGIRMYAKGIPFYYQNEIRNYHLVHERSYDVRNGESLENIKYLREKHRKYPLVSLILLILNTKFKYLGTRRFMKEK